jgi:hypothetical protein
MTAGDDRQQWINLTHWTLDPGNVAPMAGLERDLGQQAALALQTPWLHQNP